jgi:hypothetical protein
MTAAGAAADNLVHLSALHRDGSSYTIDIFPAEVARYLREERRRRALFARAYPTRDAALAALAREKEWHDINGRRLRRMYGWRRARSIRRWAA